MKQHVQLERIHTPPEGGSYVAVAGAPVMRESVPLANLQTAYDREINANARYLAFSKGACDGGYGPVGSLFLAVARAEEINAENHAAVIRSLGRELMAGLSASAVKSTPDNLKTATQTTGGAAFCVCRCCGFTAVEVEDLRCPVCSNSRHRFAIKVNGGL